MATSEWKGPTAVAEANRFTTYFPLLLEALRSADPQPMRPAEVLAWIRAHHEVPDGDLTRFIKNGKQSIFQNDVHWARFYLSQGGLVSSERRGFWMLTDEGRKLRPSDEDLRDLYVRVRDSHRVKSHGEEDEPAPGSGDRGDDEGVSYWFAGASFSGNEDQLPRFREYGIWENGYEDQLLDTVRKVKPGDRIAIKSAYNRKNGLPFNVGGEPVAVMKIKATGTVLENPGDGRLLRVAWDPASEQREWFFYQLRTTIAEVDPESEKGRRLIDFAFHGAPQDYAWWLDQPYWREKYGVKRGDTAALQEEPATDLPDEERDDSANEKPYTIEDIIDEGCFLSRDTLAQILARWRTKKNLILQGPPGTGKTWLAKRLGFALIGSNDRETERSRLRVVQFHPSLAYEDFVRGWRPIGDGRLALVDGIMMQAIQAAESEPDRAFVLVIEEINRGNPGQIFGEMLTLLEDSKRHRGEAIEIAYRRELGERVHIPENLHVVGTMNVADRSLALVDLALRRRFAFVDLEPSFGDTWRSWCRDRGLDSALLGEIAARISALNDEISKSISLGPQFRIGHSYVMPEAKSAVHDGTSWFRAKVETEIAPLLDEYWYDTPETARKARADLLKGFD
jgi:5-methylcytosine-specific restriction protein B